MSPAAQGQTVNRRRPGGYRGSDQRILSQLEHDTQEALAYASELRRRAERLDDVMGEILQEAVDSCFRMEAACRLSGRGYKAIFRILQLDQECESERMQAMMANPVHFGPRHGGDAGCSGYYNYHSARGDRSRRAEPPRERTTPTIEAAARFMAKEAGKPRIPAAAIAQSPLMAKLAYRRAAKRLHPDVGGDTRMMQRLVDAKEALDACRN